MTSVLVVMLAAAVPAAEESDDWVSNAVSQTLFFAVLEGAYTDGLSNAQIDRIIPPGQEINAHFVPNCPLCMPVIEALRLYRGRPSFRFQKPVRFDRQSDRLVPINPDHLRMEREVDAPMDARLTSPDRNERIVVIQGLVQKWMRMKLDSMRLTPEEEAAWTARVKRLRNVGMSYLEKLQAAKMADFTERKVCPACEGGLEGSCKLKPLPANQPSKSYYYVRPEIFFPVLEQLYRQGYATEDIAALAPLGWADSKVFMEHFVYGCQICNSVFEALRLYHSRPEFLSRKRQQNTFGTGLSPEQQAAWRSPDAATRRAVVQSLASSAVQARLTLWRLTPAEATAWSAFLEGLKKEGEELLAGYQQNAANNEPSMRYTGWKSCPSCDGAGGCKVPVSGKPAVDVRPLKEAKEPNF